jgi:uncharacterized DUF497 family protein
MGFKVPQHWGILGAKISIHDRAKYIIRLISARKANNKEAKRYENN